jgi:probable phosphoglycerate mutase
VEIWLIRHGETEWTITRQHTGWNDIPMTERGRESARAVGKYLSKRKFQLVLASPLQRAFETCRLAGYGEVARVEPDLREWNYGDYEGRTPDEIRASIPDWSIWKYGVSGGETIEQVADRARRTLDSIDQVDGDVAIFAHGHFLRILASCWVGLPPVAGQYFLFDPASISVLGFERGRKVFQRWNFSPEDCIK